MTTDHGDEPQPQPQPQPQRLPVVALVGRLNVGKSTLFNQLTRSRDALVADSPGLTRDRRYGFCRVGERRMVVVDTGGLTDIDDRMSRVIVEQTDAAMAEADAIVFVTDAKAGLTPEDETLMARVRRLGKPVVLAANKTDGLDERSATTEFHRMGLGEPIAMAALHGRGIGHLVEALSDCIGTVEDFAGLPAEFSDRVRICITGRPNVGKSTLINRLIGEERLVAFDQPGTTRDAIAVPWEDDDGRYTLIDTAGVRRRARVDGKVEKFSVVKTLQAIEQSHVAVLMLDAHSGIVEQDAHLLGHIIDSGRALLVAVNKWDGLSRTERTQVRAGLERKLGFCAYAKICFISALHGSGIRDLLTHARSAHSNAMRMLKTPELSRILKQAVQAHQPPLAQGRTAKLRYAHSGGHSPQRIVIHGTRLDTLPEHYKRFLQKRFIRDLKLEGTPLHLKFVTGENPYEGRKNVLTQRQLKKRQRLKRFTRRKGA